MIYCSSAINLSEVVITALVLVIEVLLLSDALFGPEPGPRLSHLDEQVIFTLTPSGLWVIIIIEYLFVLSAYMVHL